MSQVPNMSVARSMYNWTKIRSNCVLALAIMIPGARGSIKLTFSGLLQYLLVFFQQWFHMYAPLRLDMLANHISSQDEVQTDTSANQLDVNRVFKGKAEKKWVWYTCVLSHQSISWQKCYALGCGAILKVYSPYLESPKMGNSSYGADLGLVIMQPRLYLFKAWSNLRLWCSNRQLSIFYAWDIVSHQDLFPSLLLFHPCSSCF